MCYWLDDVYKYFDVENNIFNLFAKHGNYNIEQYKFYFCYNKRVEDGYTEYKENI